MKSLENIIQERRPKEEIVKYLQDNNLWNELPKLLFNEDSHLSWRATWLLSLADQTILQPLNLNAHQLIKHGEKCPSPQKREILRLLEKLVIPEDLLGVYFNWALQLWTDLRNKSSIRVVALKALARIGNTYPELNEELLEGNTPELLDPLTPAIKKQAEKIFKSLIRNS